MENSCAKERNPKGEKINLIEKNEIISDEKEISEIFNNFFSNIVSKLNLVIDEKYISDSGDIDDPVLAAIS